MSTERKNCFVQRVRNETSPTQIGDAEHAAYLSESKNKRLIRESQPNTPPAAPQIPDFVSYKNFLSSITDRVYKADFEDFTEDIKQIMSRSGISEEELKKRLVFSRRGIRWLQEWERAKKLGGDNMDKTTLDLTQNGEKYTEFELEVFALKVQHDQLVVSADKIATIFTGDKLHDEINREIDYLTKNYPGIEKNPRWKAIIDNFRRLSTLQFAWEDFKNWNKPGGGAPQGPQINSTTKNYGFLDGLFVQDVWNGLDRKKVTEIREVLDIALSKPYNTTDVVLKDPDGTLKHQKGYNPAQLINDQSDPQLVGVSEVMRTAALRLALVMGEYGEINLNDQEEFIKAEREGRIAAGDKNDTDQINRLAAFRDWFWGFDKIAAAYFPYIMAARKANFDYSLDPAFYDVKDKVKRDEYGNLIGSKFKTASGTEITAYPLSRGGLRERLGLTFKQIRQLSRGDLETLASGRYSWFPSTPDLYAKLEAMGNFPKYFVKVTQDRRGPIFSSDIDESFTSETGAGKALYSNPADRQRRELELKQIVEQREYARLNEISSESTMLENLQTAMANGFGEGQQRVHLYTPANIDLRTSLPDLRPDQRARIELIINWLQDKHILRKKGEEDYAYNLDKTFKIKRPFVGGIALNSWLIKRSPIFRPPKFEMVNGVEVYQGGGVVLNNKPFHELRRGDVAQITLDHVLQYAGMEVHFVDVAGSSVKERVLNTIGSPHNDDTKTRQNIWRDYEKIDANGYVNNGLSQAMNEALNSFFNVGANAETDAAKMPPLLISSELSVVKLDVGYRFVTEDWLDLAFKNGTLRAFQKKVNETRGIVKKRGPELRAISKGRKLNRNDVYRAGEYIKTVEIMRAWYGMTMETPLAMSPRSNLNILGVREVRGKDSNGANVKATLIKAVSDKVIDPYLREINVYANGWVSLKSLSEGRINRLDIMSSEALSAGNGDVIEPPRGSAERKWKRVAESAGDWEFPETALHAAPSFVIARFVRDTITKLDKQGHKVNKENPWSDPLFSETINMAWRREKGVEECGRAWDYASMLRGMLRSGLIDEDQWENLSDLWGCYVVFEQDPANKKLDLYAGQVVADIRSAEQYGIKEEQLADTLKEEEAKFKGVISEGTSLGVSMFLDPALKPIAWAAGKVNSVPSNTLYTLATHAGVSVGASVIGGGLLAVIPETHFLGGPIMIGGSVLGTLLWTAWDNWPGTDSLGNNLAGTYSNSLLKVRSRLVAESIEAVKLGIGSWEHAGDAIGKAGLSGQEGNPKDYVYKTYRTPRNQALQGRVKAR